MGRERLDFKGAGRAGMMYDGLAPMRRCFLLAAALCFAAFPASGAPSAQVVGRVLLPRGGPRGWDLSRVVVYLIPQNGTPPPPAPPAPSARLKVSQRDATFAPAFLVAVKGQTVDFPNDDKMDHNVFSFSKTKRFDLGVYPKGQSKSVTFDKEGPAVIFCSVHEFMNAVILVVPNPFFAVADGLGRFAIAGVPPGHYQVRAWHPTLPEGKEYVEVSEVEATAGTPVRVDVSMALFQKGGRAE